MNRKTGFQLFLFSMFIIIPGFAVWFNNILLNIGLGLLLVLVTGGYSYIEGNFRSRFSWLFILWTIPSIAIPNFSCAAVNNSDFLSIFYVIFWFLALAILQWLNDTFTYKEELAKG